MAYRTVTHIALMVSPLRQAEEFYQKVFALDVAFREAEMADGWYTLPTNACWDDAEAAGIHLGLCSLHRDAFTLALEEGTANEAGRLSHIGVQVDPQDLDLLRTSAPALGCQVVQEGPTILVFDDPYNVRWEMTTTPYDDPRRLSSGARLGRWLSLERNPWPASYPFSAPDVNPAVIYRWNSISRIAAGMQASVDTAIALFQALLYWPI